MEDLFRQFWWLIFPIFGMAMGLIGMLQTEHRAKSAIDLIKTYAEQGKDPPPELLQLAVRDAEGSSESKNGRAWTFVVFAALAAGFGVGYYVVRAEDYAFAFLIVTVVMAVLAIGSLLILIFGRE